MVRGGRNGELLLNEFCKMKRVLGAASVNDVNVLNTMTCKLKEGYCN